MTLGSSIVFACGKRRFSSANSSCDMYRRQSCCGAGFPEQFFQPVELVAAEPDGWRSRLAVVHAKPDAICCSLVVTAAAFCATIFVRHQNVLRIGVHFIIWFRDPLTKRDFVNVICGSLSLFARLQHEVAGLMRAITCSSPPAAGTHWPKSRLVQIKYCCRNAPLARPSSVWSMILHWPKTSSRPFAVNDPVNPQTYFHQVII